MTTTFSLRLQTSAFVLAVCLGVASTGCAGAVDGSGDPTDESGQSDDELTAKRPRRHHDAGASPTIDGAALYTQYCAACHGAKIAGDSATAIHYAISNNTGGMGRFSFLTSAQIAAIAAAP